MRLGAFGCLGGLIKTNKEALRLIVDGLENPDGDIRSSALDALYRAGRVARVAVPKLTELIRRREQGWWTALATLTALDALDESLIPELVLALADQQGGSEAAIALAKMGMPAARAILDAAKGFTGNTVWRAAEALQNIGKDAIPILRESLSSPDAAARQLAADVLAKLSATPESESIPGLIEALRSSEPAYRSRAIQSIQRLGPVAIGVLPALLEFLADEKALPNDRTQVAWIIGSLGPAAESAVPELLRLIGRKGSFIPAGVAYSLAQLGHGPSGILALLDASRRLKANEYDWVAQALHNCSRRGRSNVPGDDRATVREVILPAYRQRTPQSTLIEPAHIAMSKPTAKTVPTLRPFLADDSRVTRVVAVWGLRHVGTPEAAKELLPAMKDKDRLVRLHAVRALGRIGKDVDGVIEAVRAALKDRTKDVRTAAKDALKMLTVGAG